MMSAAHNPSDMRHDWTVEEVASLLNMPFNDLLFRAQTVHRENFDPNAVQVSTLLSIKTGACPEDCAYCPQSARYDTKLEKEKLMEVEAVIERQRRLKRQAQIVFAWALHGVHHARKTCRTC